MQAMHLRSVLEAVLAHRQRHRQPNPQRQSDPIVVPERRKARHAVARADQPLLVAEQSHRGGEADEVRPGEVRARAGEQHGEQEGRHQHAEDDAVGVAEQDRGRFRAGADVLVAVDHRVLGVVDGREQDVGEEQQPGERRQ